VSARTIWKWVKRHNTEGVAGLQDRSSRPRRLARRLPRYRHRQVAFARRKRWSSLRIASYFAMPVSTVVTMLQRLQLNRLPSLAPPQPLVRYEHATPCALLHLDVKKLGRIHGIGHRIHGDHAQGIGWEYVHVAIDDCTRLGYSEVLDDETGPTAAGFLARVIAWYAAQRVRIRGVLTDNGGGYRSAAHAVVVTQHRLTHRFTRPYRPQTNGKAERFIRTLLSEWAYTQAYRASRWCAAVLIRYLTYYNTRRRHSGIAMCTPAERLAARL
jgi:transposase InsO family protein